MGNAALSGEVTLGIHRDPAKTGSKYTIFQQVLVETELMKEGIAQIRFMTRYFVALNPRF